MNSLSCSVRATIVVLGSSFLYFLFLLGYIADNNIFIALTLILVSYIIMEIRYLKNSQSKIWIFNPIVVCSIMTFILGYGATNYIYFLPEDIRQILTVNYGASPSMCKLMLMAVVACCSMWGGYSSPLAIKFIHGERLNKLYKYYFEKRVPTKWWVIPMLATFGIGSKYLQIYLGIYGYSSSYERLMAAAQYTQYLALFGRMSTVALLLLSLEYFSGDESLAIKTQFFVMLFLEYFFGLISGMKSGAVFPFLIVLISQYLRKESISIKWILIILVSLFSAYSVIEPFRVERNIDVNYDGTSITNIVAAMANGVAHQNEGQSTVYSDNSEEHEDKLESFYKATGRMNISQVGAFGIEYLAINKILPEGSPDFVLSAVTAPFSAWIPRFLWNDKPISNVGLWYTQAILNKTSFSSTAMGIVTNIYITAGFAGVALCFFILGIFHKVLFEVTQPWNTSAGAIIFLAMFSSVAIISEVNLADGLIATIFRMLPIVFALQKSIYRHDKM